MKKTIILFTLLLFVGHSHAQSKRIDSLKQALAVAKEDTAKIDLLHILSMTYRWSFADTSLLYGLQEMQLSQKLNDKAREAWAMESLCITSSALGNYTKSLDFGYKALASFKELNDTIGLEIINSDLGTCYRDQGDYKKAMPFLREGLRLCMLQGSDHGKFLFHMMLASVLEKDNQLDSALYYVRRADQGWSGTLNLLGSIHAQLGYDEQAIDYYRRTMISEGAQDFKVDILDAYNGIANIYKKEGKTDSAIYYARQVLTKEWTRAYPKGQLAVTSLLADIYSDKNKSDSALKYLKLTIDLKDSLFNQQKTREAQNFAFNEQLHQLALQQTVQETQLKYKNRLNIYILLAGLLILLIVAGGLWRRNVYRKKSLALVHKQKDEIQTTLSQLRSTQAQLIQTEKMASLGELTAGIAHEIQNPLNFVNNFSEVNTELIDELEQEVDKGNLNEVKAIAKDIKENEQKINHHGKRADAIVKGMLQHSRSSSGVKEPTDISALADEYLRLAYHGLRAKDKSFNATMKTDFDESIGNINIIPQDIGRVILNLINNAFYVVDEKKKQQPTGYEPTVSVSTKKLNGKVEIKVADNGNGIPQKVVDKIFQPFFTTKPTGRGTGLGLSLSYDIVKAHGGELKVETKEGEFAEFVIRLPLKG